MKDEINMKKFMTGRWTDLIMANYTCPKEVMEPMLPEDVEVDLFEGKAVFSAVAFTFSHVKFFGVKVPFHQLFGEINIRCYVKSKKDGAKGVLFFRELAPKALIAYIARKVYNEPFECYDIKRQKRESSFHVEVDYAFKETNCSGEIRAFASKFLLGDFHNKFREFIIDRYVAFVRKKDNTSTRYLIKHKPWQARLLKKMNLSKTLSNLFPTQLQPFTDTPKSVYLIDGSEVEVYR